MAREISKTMKQAMLDLRSDDDATVMKALKAITKGGDADCIPALMQRYHDAPEGNIKSQIHDMLQSMKLPNADVALVDLLKEERFKDQQAFILSCIWHSGFQPVEHLDVIVRCALKGDFMTAFEAITVVEHMEPPFDMDVLAVCALEVEEYVEDHILDDRSVMILQLQGMLEKYQHATSPEISEE